MMIGRLMLEVAVAYYDVTLQHVRYARAFITIMLYAVQ